MHNINTQKSVCFFKWTIQKVNQERIPLTIASKRIKYLGGKINLTKEVRDLYTENYRTLLKEIKDLNKWEDIPGSRVGRLKIVKMSILPKSNHALMQSLSNSNGLFCRNEKVNPQIHMKFQWTPSSQNCFEKEQSWTTHMPQFQNLLQRYSNQNSVVLA